MREVRLWEFSPVTWGANRDAKVMSVHSLRGPFTDRGMQHLRGLDGLFGLDIDDSRLGITPAGLEPLLGFCNWCLRTLVV